MGGSAGCADHRCLEWQHCAVDAGGHAIQQERAARTEESVRRRTADGGARGEESSLHQGGAPGSAASDHSVIRAIPATALDLQREAVQLLINDFLPAGTTLGRWARPFDACLSTDNIVQACRNAWTACGLQPSARRARGHHIIDPGLQPGLSVQRQLSGSCRYINRGERSASVSGSGIGCAARGSQPRMIVRLHCGRWSR
jgi:hypothetical protein